MIALILFLSTVAFAGTNNLPVESAGVVQLQHVNKFQQALAGDFVPRDGSGNVNDGASNLGESSLRWGNVFAKQLSLIGTSGGNSVSFLPPASLSASYSLTMAPALPASLSIVRVDNLGNISFGSGASSSATSSSSLAYSTASTSPVQVSNLSVTITTTGRPVYVTCQGDGSNNTWGGYTGSGFLNNQSGNTGAVFIYRDGSRIAAYPLPAIALPASSVATLDTSAAAGSHTYAIYISAYNGGTPQAYASYVTLTAFEE